MNDKQVQEIYRKYVAKYQGSRCDNCGHIVMVTTKTYHNAHDDLMSMVELTCSQCHWSTKIDKPYKECINP